MRQGGTQINTAVPNALEEYTIPSIATGSSTVHDNLPSEYYKSASDNGNYSL